VKAPSSVPKLNLNAAKHEAQRDIEEAEKHGILPPPPPGANWFRATLHKAIELAVSYFYFQPGFLGLRLGVQGRAALDQY
jgi:hypothetical protein